MPHTGSLDYRSLPAYKPLFIDYLHRFERLSPFFPGDPFEPRAWESMSERISRREYPRAEVASTLAELNRGLGADASTLDAVEALAGGAQAVVTGQQVGLFGGPLYTLYKALSAVALAQQARQRLGRPVVAVFWMDADDHDFDEVRHTSLLDPSQQLLSLTYQGSNGEARVPVGQRRLEPSVLELMEELKASLSDSEFKVSLLEALAEDYAPGRSMSEAFGRFLLRLTRGSGLLVLDPTSPELKALGRELFARELAESEATSALVAETTERLIELGYHAQAAVSPEQVNLFYAGPERAAVTRDSSGIRLGDSNSPLSLVEAKDRLQQEPERFSPNVLLRPLYQDTLLPTLAYVAGPNELAYFAQLGDLYRYFDITMPLVASRASFTIVERSQARFLERYEVELAKLKSADESLLNEILKEQAPPQLENDLARARTCITDFTEALERDLGSVDPTLVGAVKSTRGKLLHQVKELESKTLRALKRKDETVRKQFLSTRAALFPAFEMQERKLSPVGFLNRYGWHFSEILRSGIDPGAKSHSLMFV